MTNDRTDGETSAWDALRQSLDENTAELDFFQSNLTETLNLFQSFSANGDYGAERDEESQSAEPEQHENVSTEEAVPSDDGADIEKETIDDYFGEAAASANDILQIHAGTEVLVEEAKRNLPEKALESMEMMEKEQRESIQDLEVRTSKCEDMLAECHQMSEKSRIESERIQQEIEVEASRRAEALETLAKKQEAAREERERHFREMQEANLAQLQKMREEMEKEVQQRQQGMERERAAEELRMAQIAADAELRRKRSRAAKDVQRYFRGFSSRSRLEHQRAACIIIQSFARRILCQRMYVRKRYAAVTIQAHARRMMLSRSFAAQRTASIVLQSNARMRTQWQCLLAKRNASVKLQSMSRAWTARKKIKSMKVEKLNSAVKVQAWVRMCLISGSSSQRRRMPKSPSQKCGVEIGSVGST